MTVMRGILTPSWPAIVVMRGILTSSWPVTSATPDFCTRIIWIGTSGRVKLGQICQSRGRGTKKTPRSTTQRKTGVQPRAPRFKSYSTRFRKLFLICKGNHKYSRLAVSWSMPWTTSSNITLILSHTSTRKSRPSSATESWLNSANSATRNS